MTTPNALQPEPSPDWVNYHSTIGERFVELRGSGFALSPADLRLVDDWESRGVPLSIVVAVLDDISERVKRNTCQRPRSLAYIEEEVEARFAELLAGHVGCGGCERSFCFAGAGSQESGAREQAA